jgi:hypothetical protein
MCINRSGFLLSALFPSSSFQKLYSGLFTIRSPILSESISFGIAKQLGLNFSKSKAQKAMKNRTGIRMMGLGNAKLVLNYGLSQNTIIS